MPAVTVIIPAYNSERYIRETLDSVLGQTWQDLEVIVVDDGSTDGTRDIVLACGEPVRLVEQENAGPSPARNRGIREARGEFVAFVDSDDLWTPDKLERQMALFDADERVGLVYCRSQRIDGEGNHLPTTLMEKPVGGVFLPLLYRNHCPTSGVVVRKACLDQCGVFPEDMVWAEDWHLWLRIARHYAFQAVQDALALHRMHGAALTEQQENAYAGARQVLTGALTDEDGPEAHAARKRGLHRLDRDHGLGLLGIGETRAARRAFRRAMGTGPLDIHVLAGGLASVLPAALRRPILRTWKRLVPWAPWD